MYSTSNLRTAVFTFAIAFSGTALGLGPDPKAPAKPAPAEKKQDADPAKDAPAKEGKKEAGKDASKPLPFNLTVDELSSTSFVHKNKDGTKSTNIVTEKTEIKNGKNAAKFADIKIGDTVAGLRSSTPREDQWEVVKITKFGAAAAPAKKGK